MPALARPCAIASIVQISRNALRTVALVHILVKDDPHYGSFLFVDVQLIQFVLALVDASAPH